MSSVPGLTMSVLGSQLADGADQVVIAATVSRNTQKEVED